MSRVLSGGSFRVSGIGAALPGDRVTNADLAAHLDTSDAWIRSRTGVHARHRAGPDDTTTALAVTAASAALRDADLGAADVSLVVVATATPDTACPATASRVAHELGATGASFDLNGACCGFVHALLVAASLIGSATVDTVLVVGADRFTSLVDPADRSTAVLFGDGAAAVVLRRGVPGDDYGLLGSDLGGEPAALGVLEVSPTARHLRMDGPELFRRATRALAASSAAALTRAGVDADDVDLFVPHQANARIIAAAADRLGIGSDRTMLDVAERANTSAASVPLALHAARRDGRLDDGAVVLLSAVGAGLGWASAVVRWGR